MVEETPVVLNERECEILKGVVSSYIFRAEPVSSRAVAKQRDQRLSSATIRNTMADLEEWGYLSQPHTSAGRVPTHQGYHFFIDTLMKEKELAPDLRRYVKANLGKAEDAESLTLVASHLLSELSEQVGVVLTPARGDVCLRTIEFVPLPGSKVLCVVVSSSGFIDNKVIDTDEVLPREELTRISNYMSEHFVGLTLSEARNRLLQLMADERAEVDSLMQRAFSLARAGAGHEPCSRCLGGWCRVALPASGNEGLETGAALVPGFYRQGAAGFDAESLYGRSGCAGLHWRGQLPHLQARFQLGGNDLRRRQRDFG